jgi:2,5-diamino-6-(ribosylamino)-4(3H)-pyrimidinone 5'-phosphate reductase
MVTPCFYTNRCLPAPDPPDRPWVLVNMAMTADGKIATANRRVASFGSPHDLRHLYELRATADAILSGARTLNEEDVTLDPGPVRFRRWRSRHGLPECPIRIIASGSGRIRPDARIFLDSRSPLIVLTTRRASARSVQRLEARGALVHPCGFKHLDLPRALRWLHARWHVRRLLVEGGGELNASLFRSGLVDELHLTLCPVIVGGRKAPTLAEGPNPRTLDDAFSLILVGRRRVGDELFLTFRRRTPAIPARRRRAPQRGTALPSGQPPS